MNNMQVIYYIIFVCVFFLLCRIVELQLAESWRE